MEQQAAVRQVTKRLQNGMQLSARVTTAHPDGNHHWTGAIMSPGVPEKEQFAFFELAPEVLLRSAGNGTQMFPPEVGDFARFCVEVTRARI